MATWRTRGPADQTERMDDTTPGPPQLHLAAPPGPGLEGLFDAVADDYDQSGMAFFQPMADRLVGLVSPAPGERALDIGCGRGAVTTRLASAVGPDGSVTAIDLSSRMVRHVAALLPEADVRQMDAADPDLPQTSFDLATASAVLFFLPRPRDAVRTWLSLLRPGGRLGLTTFGPVDEVWRRVDDAIEQWRPPGLPDPRVQAPDSPFTSDERLAALLTAAGGVDVENRVEQLTVHLDDPDQWLRFSFATGQRRAWTAVPQDALPGAVDTVRGLLESARDDSGTIVLSQQIRYSTVRRPS